MSHQWLRAMALVAFGAFSMHSAGHSAFSASPQAAADLAAEFTAPAEPMTLPDIPVQLADEDDVVLAKDGPDLMLINIWATWCAPCIEEMPSLDALQAELGGDDFEVVTISMDRKGMELVAPFFERTGIQALKPYTDRSGDFSFAMGARGLPVTFLVKNGEVLRMINGPADWSSEEAKEIIRAEM